MRRLTSCFVAALCIVLIQPTIGHAKAKGPVQEIVDSFYRSNNPAGLAVSIRTHDGRTQTYARGYANVESRDRTTKDTLYRIASVSKLFTTLGILTLKEQGRLSLNDPLSKYVQGFPYGDRITVKNMLQHTSGIPNFAAIEPFSSNPAKEWKSAELVDILKVHLGANPLEFEPGTKAAYSNSNFMILAIIIEVVSGMTFDSYVDKHVTAPLGMKDTVVGSDTKIMPHRAAGYEIVKGKLINAQFVSVVAPFGTGDFMSQPKDLVGVSKAFRPGVLLTQATIDEMSQPVVLKDGTTWISPNDQVDLSFGYCWELIKPKGKTEWVYTKGGAISGFFAHVLYFKGTDTTVAISANTQGNFSLLALGLKIGDAIGAVK